MPPYAVATVVLVTVAAFVPFTSTVLFNNFFASVDKSTVTSEPFADVEMYLPLSAPITPKLKPLALFNA